MRTFFLLALALALANAAPFQKLATLSCNANIEFLAASNLGHSLQIPVFDKLMNSIFGELKERAERLCPDSKENDLRRFFDPIAIILDSEDSSPLNECLLQNFDSQWRSLMNFKIPSISTCSLSSYLEDGKCFMKQNHESVNASVEISLSKCQNWIPSFSITCSGSACSHLALPCKSDDECGGKGLTCLNLQEIFFDGISQVEIDIMTFGFMQAIGIYDTNDESPGCFQNRGNQIVSPDNDLFSFLLTTARNMIYGVTGDVNTLKICGSQNWFLGSNPVFPPLIGEGEGEGEVGKDALDLILEQIPEEFQSWNGIDSQGKSVHPVVSVFPNIKKSPEKYSIIEFTCQKNIESETFETGLLSNMSPIVDQIVNLFYDVVSCRSPSSESSVIYDKQRFLVEYGIWSPSFWLYLVDLNYHLNDTFSTDFNLFFLDWNDFFPITNLPQSCNFERFEKNGICEFDFDGLKDLLMIDVTLRFSTQSCGSNSYFSSLSIECLGKDCILLDGLRSCDETSQCFGHSQCQDAFQFLSYLIEDSEQFEELLLSTDLISELFIIGEPDETSNGNLDWSKSLQKMLLEVFGSVSQPSNVVSEFQYCLPPIEKTELQSWILSIIEPVENGFSLGSSFKSVVHPPPTSAPTASPTSTPTETPSHHKITVGEIVGLVVGLIFVVGVISIALVLKRHKYKSQNNYNYNQFSMENNEN